MDTFDLEAMFMPQVRRQPEFEPWAVQGTDEAEHSTVMQLLGLLSRPQWAAAGAFTEDNPLEGIWKGLKGKEYHWGDVFGIPEGQSEDDWGSWLGKEGARLGLDLVLDPMNLVSPAKVVQLAGKGLRATGLGVRALEKVAASGAGRAFMEHLPSIIFDGHNYKEIEDTITRIMREGSRVPIQEEAMAAHNALQALKEQKGFDILDLWQAAERGGTDAARFADELGVLAPLRDKQQTLMDELVGLSKKLGREDVPRKIGEEGYGYMPHMDSPFKAASRKGGQGGLNDSLGDMYYSASSKNPGREIYRWERPDGSWVIASEGDKGLEHVRIPGSRIPDEELIAKAKAWDPDSWEGDAYSKLFMKDMMQRVRDEPGVYASRTIPDRMEFQYLGEPVTRKQATLKEILDSGYREAKDVQLDPVVALLKNSTGLQDKVSFLKILDEGLGGGWIKDARSLDVKDLLGLQDLGYRQTGLKGMEGLLTTGAIANRLENLGGTAFSDQALGGSIARALHGFVDSGAGNLAREGLDWWKRNTLANPGWLSGNAVTNPIMLMTGGAEREGAGVVTRMLDEVLNPFRVPGNMAGALKVQRGAGRDIFEGLTNAALRKELETRGLLDAGEAGQALRDYLGKADRVPMTGQIVGKLTGGQGKVSDAAQWIADKWGGFNQAVLGAGRSMEGNSRVAAALDYLKKNSPELGKMLPEDAALALDKAAGHAKDVLLDHQAMTPFEKDLSLIFPFLSWQRGILGRTLSQAYNEPHRLAAAGKILDAVIQPMDPQLKAIADNYVQEGSPVTGLLGTSFDDIFSALGFEPKEQGTRMALMSRFLPWGNVEQMSQRPLDALMSMVNPGIKAPYELLANRNTFKDRAMDELAGGFPGSVVNPMIGGPYQLSTQQRLGTTLPAAWDYLVSQSPIGRNLQLVGDLGRGRLWEDDPYKYADEPTEAIGSALTGGKFYGFDESKALERKIRQWKQKQTTTKALMNYAARRGADADMQHYMDQLMGLIEQGYVQ